MLKDILPDSLLELINNYVNVEKLYEIRLRINKPIILNIANTIYSINQFGLCSHLNGIKATKQLIDKIVSLACENSVYAVNSELKYGFITASGGIRIGVAGEFVIDGHIITSIKDFFALNIRIPHEVKGCSKKIMHYIIDNRNHIYNTLILSPPGLGKTTMLRDVLNNFSMLKGYLNCLVIDERYEIVGKQDIKNVFEVGYNVDVLYGGNKSYSINCGIRSMAPNVIFTDEIGTEEDAKSIVYAKNCGVNVIATMHAKSLEDFVVKEELSTLFKKKVFNRFILLSNRKGIGTIEGVYDENFKLLYGE